MLKILFAHPDQKLSQIYIQRMRSHFSIDSAHDGLTALRRIKVSKPSLIVSDYHLPILSGISLLRFVRNTDQFSAMPFVFLSTHHDNRQALSLGANDWLDQKICHPDLLLERIYKHLKTNKYGLQIYRA